MATDSAHRAVSIDRVTAGTFTVTNDRGGQIAIGTGGDADFTPVELLLAAIGGCTSRVLLPEAIRRSHDRLCTVSRTVELGTPIHIRPAAPRVEPA